MRKAYVSLVALAIAAGLWNLGRAVPAAAQNYGQNQQASGLTARPTPATTDIIPCQPVGGVTQGCTAGGIANLSSFTVNAPCDGVTDITAQVLAAAATGVGVVQLPAGVCILSSTYSATSEAQAGQVLRGMGEPDATGQGAGTTTIRFTSAVTVGIKVDGTSFGSWVLGFGVENLGIDMANMADSSSSIAIDQLSAWDVHYSHVRVLNYGSNKVSWQFNTGAYLTNCTDCQGGRVVFQGTSASIATTTISFFNSDIASLQLNGTQAIGFHGGAIQPTVVLGVTPVIYLPPGTTPYGFSPNSSGLYAAVAMEVQNSTQFSTFGTDIEVNGATPSNCTLSGWPYGAYNDGVHGCLKLIPVFEVASTASNTQFNNGNWYGIYPLDYGINTAVRPLQIAGNVTGYDINGNTFDAGYHFFAGVLSGVTDFSNIGYFGPTYPGTWKIDSATGLSQFRGLTLQPASDGGNLLYVNNAEGATEFDCNTRPITSSPACGFPNGVYLNFYSDNLSSVLTASIGGSTGHALFYGGIDSTPIGQTTAEAGTFTSIAANNIAVKAVTIQPAADGSNALYLNNAEGAAILVCNTRATVGSSSCGFPNGVTLGFYSDGASADQTAGISGSTGHAFFDGGIDSTPFGQTTPAAGAFTDLAAKSLNVQPGTDGTGIINLFNAEGVAVFTCKTNSTVAYSSCGIGSGAELALYSDTAFSTKTIDANGSNGHGFFTGGLDTTPIGQTTPEPGAFTTLAARNLNIQPASDGVGVINFYNAEGQVIYSCKTSGTVTSSSCGFSNGVDFALYIDNSDTNKSIDLNGTSGVGTFLGLTTSPVAYASLPSSPATGERAVVSNTSVCTKNTAVNGSGSTACAVIFLGGAWVGE